MILIANDNGDWWVHEVSEWGPLHYLDTEKLSEKEMAEIREYLHDETITADSLPEVDKLEQILWHFGHRAGIRL